MSLLERVHERHVHGRRVAVLTRHLAEIIPRDAEVLDVGCGDGKITSNLSAVRADLTLQGVEVSPREDCQIPAQHFDGLTLPLADQAVDVVQFIDVLHHTDDPMVLLREASRVARRAVVIKDHLMEGFLSGSTLRLMDRVGNARHGVALPHNYWRREQWRDAILELDWTVESWQERLGLYWWPASCLFDRSLHFIARLSMNER